MDIQTVKLNQWFSLDEVFKSAAYGWEAFGDPATAHNNQVNVTAFQKAFNTDLTIWEFFEKPEQTYRRDRFGIGMQGVAAFQPAETVLEGVFCALN